MQDSLWDGTEFGAYSSSKIATLSTFLKLMKTLNGILETSADLSLLGD
jgi:hypothetical protein